MSETTPTEPNDATQVPDLQNNEGSKLEAQLLAAKQEAAANYDRYTRSVADLENFRKRTMREKDELRQYAVTGLMEDVVPILDNLGLGLAAAKQKTDVKSIVEGVSLIMEQFKTTLGRHGLKEVNPAGQKFDPNFHECISHQPNAEVAEENVIQVVRLGYTLNGRLIRPASVIVSSGPAK
ncbi:MAG: nucleotide exchange factor GrpE [Lacunisphaera sp.]